MPRLEQPVGGALARDRETVQLPRQPDGEVADVDHLLDLPEALRADLAGLDGNELAELRLVRPEQLPEPADHVAARGCRRRAPGGEGLGRHGDGALDVA